MQEEPLRTLLSTQGIETSQSVTAVQYNSNFIHQPASFYTDLLFADNGHTFRPITQSVYIFATPRISVNQPHSGARSTRL